MRLGIIDCDVHPSPRDVDEFREYLRPPFRDRYSGGGRGFSGNPVHGRGWTASRPPAGRLLTREELDLLMEHLDQLAFLTADRTWPEAAPQSVLAHLEVTVAIPGIRSPAQAEENVGSLAARPLSMEELPQAHRLYEGRFGQDAIPR